MIALQTLLPALAGLLFLLYLGYALTFWLLPAALGGLRWAALPWTGYAAFVVLAQFATQAGLDMGATAILALALATAANALYAWRHGARPPASLSSPAGRVVVGLTLGLLVLGVAPLWLYGYHTIIGENWDGGIYLALGAYLRAYAQPALAQAPANPLLHILLVPPYSVRTHGFSYFQAALSALTGQPSLITLAPALALLRALAVPASYFFYRAAWRLGPAPGARRDGRARAQPVPALDHLQHLWHAGSQSRPAASGGRSHDPGAARGAPRRPRA